MLDIHANKIIANKFVGEFENNNDGFNIGDIKWSASEKVSNGFLLCDGASIARNMYPELFEAIGTIYGSVDEEHFNLPNLINRFVEGDYTVGQYKDAGLPNITGTSGYGKSVFNGTTRHDVNGAFKTFDGYDGGCAPGSSVLEYNTSFDASRSNPIYGKSNTVQPNSLTARPYIKAFDTVKRTIAVL